MNVSDDILALAHAALEDDKKAMPGPWLVRPYISDCGEELDEVSVNDADDTYVADLGSDRESAAFIAAARTREPALAREVIRLTGCLSKANDNHEKFERLWYLTQDERDDLRAELERVRTFIAGIPARTKHGHPCAPDCVKCGAMQFIDVAEAKETK